MSDQNNLEQEGDDVYFECLIVSNPAATRLEWYHRVTSTIMRIIQSTHHHKNRPLHII